ncbi:hypothetical protein HGR_06791 [Hylemonella gracilis ATCC 19624]|uniref:Uncharacterized protein n=1 Tax=Hylemonella gracilis ATCC 19624 TaxID=887062 RepID=F3KSC9_9BURK|nr:hypothetical protein HGR_06791 [Hylemonella gracilis ATCC 19624]
MHRQYGGAIERQQQQIGFVIQIKALRFGVSGKAPMLH